MGAWASAGCRGEEPTRRAGDLDDRGLAGRAGAGWALAGRVGPISLQCLLPLPPTRVCMQSQTVNTSAVMRTPVGRPLEEGRAVGASWDAAMTAEIAPAVGKRPARSWLAVHTCRIFRPPLLPGGLVAVQQAAGPAVAVTALGLGSSSRSCPWASWAPCPALQ